MASSACGDVLQHPEVLDREDLLEILQKRCIPLQEIDNLDKEQLVFLFYKYVSPLPQRIHQLRRAKREPPNSSKNDTTSSFSVFQSTSRKRISDINNQAPKVKIPRSDLEHVLINNGPSKNKPEQPSHESNQSLSKPEASNHLKNSELKSRPVKLNRKSLNLELKSNTEVVNRKSSSDNSGQECSQSHCQSSSPQEASQESSDSSLDDMAITKTKFRKIDISWP